MEDALVIRRADLEQSSACEVFTQKHAKHRRLAGVFTALGGQVNARRGRIGRQDQAQILAALAELEDDIAAVRLKNPIEPGIGQPCIKFCRQAFGGNSVEWHAVPPGGD